MDQQKIDRLFREKLDNFEATPSAGAWTRVEKKIRTGHNPAKFYWIAAAVSLLIISWAMWPQQTVNDLTPIASDVTHPMQIQGQEWNLPLVSTETEEKEKVTIPNVRKQSPVQLVAKVVEVEVKEEAETIAEPELKIKTAVALEETTLPEVLKESEAQESKPELNEPMKVDLSKVKITYIASTSEKKQEADSTSRIKKLFAIAGKLSPGEVLADIKTAKDEFINGGFKKNKDRTSL